MKCSSSVEVDSLFSFSDKKQKKRFEELCKTSLNVQSHKKKIIQNTYKRIESGLKTIRDSKNLSDVELKKINDFQLSKFDVHPSLNNINRDVLEKDLKFVLDCGKEGFKVLHDCEETLFRHMRCGNDKNCFVCNHFASMKRMLSIFQVLTLLDTSETDEMDFSFAFPTLTYPQNHFDTKKLSKEEIYNLIFSHSNKFKRKFFGNNTTSVTAPHSWSSAGPLRKQPHFHSHLVIPDFVFSPVVERNIASVPHFKNIEGNPPFKKFKKISVDLKKGTVKTFTSSDRTIVGYSNMERIQLHKTKEKLQEMRDFWAKTIKYDGEVNVHYQYSNSRKKLAHYLKYILRGYIQDANKYLLENDPDKKTILTPDKEKIVLYHSNFQSNFNRVRWYGFMCNSQRGVFLNNFIPKEVFEILSQLNKIYTICPKCKKEVDFRGSNTCRFNDKTMLRVVTMTLLQLTIYNQQEQEKHTFDSRVKMKKRVEK